MNLDTSSDSDFVIRSSVWDEAVGRSNWTRTCKGLQWHGTNFQTLLVTDRHQGVPRTDLYMFGGRSRSTITENTNIHDLKHSSDSGFSWKNVEAHTTFSPPRSDYAAAWDPLTDKMYVMGGWSFRRDYLNDVWMSEDRGLNWTLVCASAPWFKRLTHSLTIAHRIRQPGSTTSEAYKAGDPVPEGYEAYSVLLVSSGFGGWDEHFNDVWASEDNGVTWTCMVEKGAFPARYSHTMKVLPNGDIILIGGVDSMVRSLNDVWVSKDLGRSWICLHQEAPFPSRYYHTCEVDREGNVLVIAGLCVPRLDVPERFLSDLWRSSDQGATWELLYDSSTSFKRVSRTQESFKLATADRLLTGLLSGRNNLRTLLWRSNPGLFDSTWASRYAHGSGIGADGALFLAGGEDQTNTCLEDVWCSFITPLKKSKEIQMAKELCRKIGIPHSVSRSYVLNFLFAN